VKSVNDSDVTVDNVAGATEVQNFLTCPSNDFQFQWPPTDGVTVL